MVHVRELLLMSYSVLVGCTTLTVLQREDGDGSQGAGGAGASASESPSSSSGTGMAGGAAGAEPACVMAWDWDVPIPIALEGTWLEILALGREQGAFQLLTRDSYTDEILTTRIEADGAAPVVSVSVVRGTLQYFDAHTRWTALPEGGFELAHSAQLWRLPSGEGPAMVEPIPGEGYPRVAWDRTGARYVLRHVDDLVEVEAPDGTVHELGASCSVQIDSAVGDGVLVQLGWYCSNDEEEEERRTIFVGPDGLQEVDLTTVSWFGRGAGERSLGVGFLGHIMEIGAQGTLGDLVAATPWDGNAVPAGSVELVPWLDGFAVISLDMYSADLRGIKVRAFPGYGARVESERLDSTIYAWDAAFTTAVDETSGGLVVAYFDGYDARLARLSCTEVGR